MPTIISVPPSGNNVAISTNEIAVTFNEAMDTGTNGTVEIGGTPLTGTQTWSSDNKTVTIPFGSDITLDYLQTYTVAISGFEDLAGNVMTSVSAGTHNFTVTDGTDAISATPINHTFPTETVGYVAVSPVTITVKNEGTRDVSGLSASLNGTNSADFTLGTLTATTIASGASLTITVEPNTGLTVGSYSATVDITGDNNTSASVAVSFTVNANTGGTITSTHAATYTSGSAITISATPNSGYKFNGWSSNNGGTFANANSASTTFTMPDKAVALTANFTST